MIEQARRSLISNTVRRWATPWRIAAGPTIFCQELVQRRLVQHGVRQQSLQLAVLFFQRPQPLGVRHAHAPELGLPGVYRPLRDAVLAGQLARLRPSLILPKDPDDLLFRKSRSLHPSVLSKGRTLAPRGGISQGQVTAPEAHRSYNAPGAVSLRCET